MRDEAAQLEEELVVLARFAGESWEDIAWSQGITRQAMLRRHPGADRAAEELDDDSAATVSLRLALDQEGSSPAG